MVSRHLHTVWKFHYFTITQILREINFGDSRRAKSAILTHLENLKFDFYEFYTFLRLKFTKNQNSESPQLQKMAFLKHRGFQKSISRKILVTEKCCNFHDLCQKKLLCQF